MNQLNNSAAKRNPYSCLKINSLSYEDNITHVELVKTSGKDEMMWGWVSVWKVNNIVKENWEALMRPGKQRNNNTNRAYNS